MINHDLRCIFIHIQRCAGTSIEQWLCGADWWDIEQATKHLIASQARTRYAPWWDAYFKFSVVRDPYTRIPSMLKYADNFGLAPNGDGTIDFSGYARLFGEEIVVEHDHRFVAREEVLLPRHRPRCVYGNILDDPLDFVARFEALDADMALVRERLGVAAPFDLHLERSDATEPIVLADSDRAWIAAAYADDFAAYGYAI